MDFLLKCWIASKKPVMIHEHTTLMIDGLGFSRIIMVAEDFRYIVLEIFHTETAILGKPSQKDVLALNPAQSSGVSLYEDSTPAFDLLDLYSDVYESQRKFNTRIITNITKKALEEYASSLAYNFMSWVSKQESHGFKVISSALKGTKLIVVYQKSGRYYCPLELNALGTSLVPRQYFDDSSKDFENFITGMCGEGRVVFSG